MCGYIYRHFVCGFVRAILARDKAIFEPGMTLESTRIILAEKTSRFLNTNFLV